MKKLSSNILYWKFFLTALLGPLILVGIIYVLSTRRISPTFITIYYALASILFLYNCFGVSKYKKVLYDKTKLIISNYITNETIEIPLTNVTSIVKVNAFYQIGNSNIYKITFVKDDKIHKVFFYKSLNLYLDDDIASIVGIVNKD